MRVEDLDWQREIPGAASEILHTLERLGMEWDDDVIYQSKRSGIYQNALDILDKHGLIYPCNRSRKEITDSSMMGISGPIYPGTCLKNSVPISNRVYALCIRISDDLIEFDDICKDLILRN